jgi:hypothetical protein
MVLAASHRKRAITAFAGPPTRVSTSTAQSQSTLEAKASRTAERSAPVASRSVSKMRALRPSKAEAETSPASSRSCSEPAKLPVAEYSSPEPVRLAKTTGISSATSRNGSTRSAPTWPAPKTSTTAPRYPKPGSALSKRPSSPSDSRTSATGGTSSVTTKCGDLERGRTGMRTRPASGMVRTLAGELGPFGITANAIAPGIIETPQTLDAVNSLGAEGVALTGTRQPVRRVGTARDIAATYLFLASEEASFITGQTIVVDGGRLLLHG